MKILFIISTSDGETIYNAMRLANVGIQKGDNSACLCWAKASFLNRLTAINSI